jgi:hypothetical protein
MLKFIRAFVVCAALLAVLGVFTRPSTARADDPDYTTYWQAQTGQTDQQNYTAYWQDQANQPPQQ